MVINQRRNVNTPNSPRRSGRPNRHASQTTANKRDSNNGDKAKTHVSLIRLFKPGRGPFSES